MDIISAINANQFWLLLGMQAMSFGLILILGVRVKRLEVKLRLKEFVERIKK